MLKILSAAVLLNVAAFLLFGNVAPAGFHFVILGDRTGGAQPGVFEEALREAAGTHPAFVLTVGDAIEGGNDNLAASEWQSVLSDFSKYTGHLQIFFTPGNHDVWSEQSAHVFGHYTKHPLHYSFDFEGAHFTVLDNSRADQLTADETNFLEKDLAQNAERRVKFIVFHRPSWILQALLRDRKSNLQLLARKYHVQYFIAGHIHQMLSFQVDEVHYLSMPSAGGHLRGDKRYENGWFFAYSLATVHGDQVSIEIHELAEPFGKGRTTTPANWGAAGLLTAARSNVAPTPAK